MLPGLEIVAKSNTSPFWKLNTAEAKAEGSPRPSVPVWAVKSVAAHAEETPPLKIRSLQAPMSIVPPPTTALDTVHVAPWSDTRV